MATIARDCIFTDREDREWKLAFDGPKFEAIQEAMDINIGSEDGSGMLQVCENGVNIVRVCWIMCEEQAEKKEVTSKQFGEAMASGEVIEGAEKALRAALLGFTRPSRRSAITAVWESQDRLTAAMTVATVEKTSDPETQAMLVDAGKARMTETLAMVVKELKTFPSGPTATGSPDTSDAAPKE